MLAPYFPHPLYYGYHRAVSNLLWYAEPPTGLLKNKWPQTQLENLFFMGGQLCPWDADRQVGLACVTYLENIHMTALAFWDFPRNPASAAVFWLPGKVPRRRAIEAARKAFPQIFKTYTFEVRLWGQR